MAYTATSEYEYITGDELEARSGQDYSAKLSKYTEDVVVAVISQAERTINTKCNTSFTGTIPDAVKMVTIELSYRMMFNMMITDGPKHTRDWDKHILPLWDKTWDVILSPFILSKSNKRTVYIKT